MNWSLHNSARWICLVVAFSLASSVYGQAEQPQAAAPAAGPAAAPYRQLAPGVMKSVDASPEIDETFARHDVVELTAVDPNFKWAKDVDFRRDIWHLNLQFKPVRMIWVDVPQPGGKMQRKLIWYMIYSVTNPGKTLHPLPDENGTFKVETIDQPIRFVPEFLLVNDEFNKTYPDRVVPAALGPIRMREDPARNFLTSVDIVREIPVGETLWGVAMWEDVDPRIDRFSVQVHGLTNAYKWQDEPGKFKPGDTIGTGRRLARKTLKLNFWRPGDEFYE
ncbi:MAG: hypothetical protein HUU20_09735, partial [Pirellulales bacterium]|nr:hypothetical protein [Pirellulales bacterium]